MVAESSAKAPMSPMRIVRPPGPSPNYAPNADPAVGDVDQHERLLLACYGIVVLLSVSSLMFYFRTIKR